MRKIKLIWDFRGPYALKIAEHHEIHLKEYIAVKNFNVYSTGIENLSELHSIAFMIVDETDVRVLRQTLKPQRGLVNEP